MERRVLTVDYRPAIVSRDPPERVVSQLLRVVSQLCRDDGSWLVSRIDTEPFAAADRPECWTDLGPDVPGVTEEPY